MDQFEAMEQAFAQSVQAPQQKNEEEKEIVEDGTKPNDTTKNPKDDGNASDDASDDNLEVDDSEEGEAVGIPEELKEYETFIKSRGLEGKIGNPIEFSKELLKSYTNAEKALGEKGNNEKLFVDRIEELEGAITGDIDEINKYRKAYGLDPVSVLNPEDEGKEAREIFNLVDQMVASLKEGKSNPELERKFLEWANSKEQKLQRHLTLKEAGLTKPTVGKEKIQMQAMRVLREIEEENKISHKDAIETLDVIFKDPSVERIFTRIYGRDPSKLIATSEQGKDLFALAKKLKLAENFEQEVNKRVKEQLKKTAGRISSSGVGARSGNPQAKKPLNNHEVEMATMFGGGYNGMNIH